MDISPAGNSVTATQDEVPEAGSVVGWPIAIRPKGENGKYFGPIPSDDWQRYLTATGLAEDEKVVVRHSH